ncbi:MAG: zinc ribbon domain-containing protein [Lachnospiraceae bacterium]|nr:zinc ribbon domain-containing protein [Lachnospiraceae bacterium]
MKCTKCGAYLPADAVFCRECGTRVSAREIKETRNTFEATGLGGRVRGKKGPLAVVAICFTAYFIISLMVFAVQAERIENLETRIRILQDDLDIAMSDKYSGVDPAAQAYEAALLNEPVYLDGSAIVSETGRIRPGTYWIWTDWDISEGETTLLLQGEWYEGNDGMKIPGIVNDIAVTENMKTIELHEGDSIISMDAVYLVQVQN